jgi:prefoldin subunit 5
MSARQIDLERLHARLKVWNAELEHIEDKLRRLRPEHLAAPGTEAEARLRADLEALRRLRDGVDEDIRNLEKVEKAGAGEWDNLLLVAEQALAALGDAFERTRSHFRE